MGESVNENNGENIRIVATDGNKNGGGSTASTSTENPRTDSRTDTNGGNVGGSTDGGRTDTKETIVSELAILSYEERELYKKADETEKKRLLRNAKRRERYAKQKTDNGQSVKPRKVNSKKSTTKKDETDRTQINAVIGGISSAIASRPNCQHWMLTESEIDTITKPLCEMLKESEVFEKVSEHSNEIALVTACFTVFAPRILTTVMIEKEKRKNEPKPTVTVKTTENKKSDKRDGKGTPVDNTNNGTSGYWLGDALY